MVRFKKSGTRLECSSRRVTSLADMFSPVLPLGTGRFRSIFASMRFCLLGLED